MATITGTSGNDDLETGSGNDTVDGLAGADQIRTNEGDDTVYGGAGNDRIEVGVGDNVAYGGDGDDEIRAGDGNDYLDGGAGDDLIRTGAGSDTVVFGDGSGADTIEDFEPTLDVVELSSSGISTFADIQARMVETNGDAMLTLDDGSTLRFKSVKPEELSAANFDIVDSPVCFTPGTLILTPRGEIPVEDLAPGDLVHTLDAGPQPVRWTGRRALGFGPGPHRHKPIEIKPGALGAGLPRRALRLSPQHRLLMRGPLVHELFGQPEVLALAKGLIGLPGIRQMKGRRDVEYVTILLDRHHVLAAEGAAAESFFPGPTALSMLPARQRGEILSLFPSLRDEPVHGYGPPARRVLTRREARTLASRIADVERDVRAWQADLDADRAQGASIHRLPASGQRRRVAI